MTTPPEGQTPVEELIGWERRWWPVAAWRTPDDRIAERAEVDDLLAHLRADPVPGWMFRDVSAWRGWTSFSQDTPSVAMVQDDRHDIHFHGTTLLAALEAAVRAVHDEGAKR